MPQVVPLILSAAAAVPAFAAYATTLTWLAVGSAAASGLIDPDRPSADGEDA